MQKYNVHSEIKKKTTTLSIAIYLYSLFNKYNIVDYVNTEMFLLQY